MAVALPAAEALRFEAHGAGGNDHENEMGGSRDEGRYGNHVHGSCAGILFTDVALAIEGVTFGGTFSGRETSDSPSLYWGLGLKYRISDQWQVKFELNQYDVGSRNTTGKATIDIASLGVVDRF